MLFNKFVFGEFDKTFLAVMVAVGGLVTLKTVEAQVVVQPQIIVEPQSNGQQTQPPIYSLPGDPQTIVQPVVQATPQNGGLTVESIYDSKKFTPSKFDPKWEKTGAKFVQSKPSKEIEGGSDLIAIDPLTDKQTTLLSAAQMIPSGETKSLKVADHQWANDRELALIFTLLIKRRAEQVGSD